MTALAHRWCLVAGLATTLLLLVVGASAERFGRIVAAHEPRDRRTWSAFGKRNEVDDRSYCGMARAQNGNALAGVPLALRTEHIWHAIGNAGAQVALTPAGAALFA